MKTRIPKAKGKQLGYWQRVSNAFELRREKAQKQTPRSLPNAEMDQMDRYSKNSGERLGKVYLSSRNQ